MENRPDLAFHRIVYNSKLRINRAGDSTNLFVDQPPGGKFETANPTLAGWFSTAQSIPWDKVVLKGRAGKIPFRHVDRPDVIASLPSHWSVLGFVCSLQAEHLTHADPQIRLELDGQFLAELTIKVTAEAIEAMTELRRARAAKRQWCLDHARCPACSHPRLRISPASIVCERCSTSFPQSGESINFLSDELYRASSLEETANVSMNPYDPTGWNIINAVDDAGGKVLDCGAGLRTIAIDAVVNLDILDMPSTDVLGVGQALPFRDGCFDAVFSQAVLEHVSDPFACARELVRVLKPNGQLYATVPFLSPEHGYPNHYYNMTRQGLRNLFPDLELIEHVVPDAGSPIVALHWMIRLYAAHLSEDARQKFLGMSLGDLISKGQFDYDADSIVKDLSPAGKWELACTTSLVMSKPG